MTGADSRSIRQLFKEWRSGDAHSGQVMAQRIADWYYAVATSRLGEERGRQPCDEACFQFGEGVVSVTESRHLESWSHGVIAKEVERAGRRAKDGDTPSLYTAGQRPKELLRRAREALPAELALLEAAYGEQAEKIDIDRLAEPLGGNPLGILTARYRVKRWLRDHGGVEFEVVPDKPVLDRAPMPLYEADRMASSAEETQFELWMLSDFDLCRDIAEFAHFSIALRGGLGEQVQASSSPMPEWTEEADATQPAPKSGLPIIPILVVGAVIVTAAAAVVTALLLGWIG